MIFGHQDDQQTNQGPTEGDDSSFTVGATQASTTIEPNMEAPGTPPLSNDPLAAFGDDANDQGAALDQATDTLVNENAAPLTADSTALSDESAALASLPPKPETPSVIKPHETPKPEIPSVNTPSDTTTANIPQDLFDLKQKALNDLGPLVDHLDQTPEEKFRTTMMLIQSTDNDSLIKDAYAAANAITDDKIRAQALLDVVNEINYFTHKKEEK